jgi:hypothetical protein
MRHILSAAVLLLTTATADQRDPDPPPTVTAVVLDSALLDAAAMLPDAGALYLHPTFYRLDPALQAFVVMHEVGHLTLRHRYPGTEAQELAADCWAAQQLAPADARRAAQVWTNLRQPQTLLHPPSPRRAAHLLSCITKEG